MSLRAALTFVGLTFFSFSAESSPPDLETLLSPELIRSIKISPDGEHVAASVFSGGRHTLQILKTKTKQRVGGLDVRTGGDRSEVGSYWWANNSRVVGQVVEAPLGHSMPSYYGELFGVDVDGGNPMMLFGARASLFDQASGRNANTTSNERAWAYFVHRYPKSPSQILISQERFSRKQNNPPEAVLLNVNTGKVRKSAVAKATLPKSRFFADEDGEPRLIIGRTSDDNQQVLARFGEEEWRQLDAGTIGDRYRPVSTIVDGQLYVLDDFETDRRSLFQYHIERHELDLIYQHNSVDVHSTIASSDLQEVLAVVVYDGYPKYLLLDSEHPERGLLRELLAVFPGSLLSITSRTDNGKLWVVRKSSSTDPGSYYLFDTESKNLSLLTTAKPELSADSISARNRFHSHLLMGLRLQVTTHPR